MADISSLLEALRQRAASQGVNIPLRGSAMDVPSSVGATTFTGGNPLAQGGKITSALDTLGQGTKRLAANKSVLNTLSNPVLQGALKSPIAKYIPAIGASFAGADMYNNGVGLENSNDMLASLAPITGSVGVAYGTGNAVGKVANAGIDMVGGEKGALGKGLYNFFNGDTESQPWSGTLAPKKEAPTSTYQGINPYDYAGVTQERNRWIAKEDGRLPDFDKSKQDQTPAIPQMARPERDMTPMIEANQAYDRQRNDVGALADKERGVYDNLANMYKPMGSSFGGLMANQRSLEAIEALNSRKGKSYADQSGHVAALPYLSAIDKAGDSSREMQRYYDKAKISSIFDPEHSTEMTKLKMTHLNSQIEGEKNKLATDRMRLLATLHGQKSGGIPPAQLLMALEKLQDGTLSPENYNTFIKQAPLYNQPTNVSTQQ